MARIVVTGATGFIGGHVARRLQATGHRVVAIGRDTDALRRLAGEGLDACHADLAVAAPAAAFDGADAVVHAAALSSPWGRRESFLAVNVDGTQRVLDAARAAGVRRVVHLSSPSIYFRLRDQLDVAETFAPPRRWITPYAESKWESERRVHRACADGAAMTAAILRPRAVFGDGDRAIFPRLIAAARRGRFPLVDGGRARIDVTHVDNVVQAVERALDAAPSAPVSTFNITNGEPMAVRELLDALFGALRLDVRYLPLPRVVAMTLAGTVEALARVDPRGHEPVVSRYTLGVLAYSQTLDIRAARAQLGYAPTTRVRDGIARFAACWTAPAASP